MIFSGRAWVFAGELPAAEILPAQFADYPEEELGAFVLYGHQPDPAKAIAPKDILVTTGEVGRGEYPARAVRALMQAGVGGVIAPAFVWLFFRACINLGLPPLTLWEAGEIRSGDRLRADLAARVVKGFSSGTRYPIRDLSDLHVEILSCGGMEEYIKAIRQQF
jgi:3-isopropylmalate dehydratase small subunit